MSLNSFPDESSEEYLDLRQYLSLFWHWVWLFLLIAFIAGVVAFYASKRMIPYYQSSATVLVNEAPASQTIDYSSVMMSQKLTRTYSNMMAKEPVLSEVASQLNLILAPEDLKKFINITPLSDTQLIQVTVETTDPYLSADIANTIVDVFSEQILGIQSMRFSQSKATIETQLSDIEKQIAFYENLVNDAATSEEKDRFDDTVAYYRRIYSNLLQSYESIRLSEAESVSSVVMVESAMPNIDPVKPNILQNTLFATLAGFFLASIVVFVREALDETIKTPEDISGKFNLPILGIINRHNREEGAPITLAEPCSPTTEAYRTLRTNVSYASMDLSLSTLIVTSAEPGEGKTTVISNLAVVFAQSGKRVIVADCDLRHPRIHICFRVNNRRGMSNLFAQSSEMLDGYPQRTQVDNLTVIPAGYLPPNPAELLDSKKMQSILDILSKYADMVLVDSPPILVASDAAVIAPALDGVLLVARPGKTNLSALSQAIEQIHHVKANLLGVVLNGVDLSNSTYGYRYKSYRNYAAYKEYYGSMHPSRKKKVK
jgi:capsular exopolysaccharide synthesis family protein